MDVSGTPETILDSQVHPATPPTATMPTADQIASMVASSMEMARRENQSKVEADNKKLLQTMSDNNRRETEVAISTCVKDITSRLSNVEVSVANTERVVGDLASTVDTIKAAQVQMQETLTQLSRNLSTSRSAPSLGAAAGSANKSSAGNLNLGQTNNGVIKIHVVPSPFNNGNFNRIPDPTKIFVNTKNKANVSAIKFGEAFSALALEANIDNGSFKIIADVLDNGFEIQSTSDTSTATKECATFLASLSLGRGQYKPQQVEGNDGSAIQFFCNPDKNRAQVRRGKSLSKLARPS